jgi:hypothetical protein
MTSESATSGPAISPEAVIARTEGTMRSGRGVESGLLLYIQSASLRVHDIILLLQMR